ncbi:Mitogen-activated protein kinase [Phytophthora megakarya]|uniref:Mitogen-activated protein kinase n=1 Tax=Phytophthora megakarya TaxID=4795 RepID=A0A225VHQ5_9STRA|nr:Mitogen-activated protein kinase [Phytophthora megakarya]
MANNASSHNTLATSSGSVAGFKVYGSLFKVSPRYQFLNPLGKGSYGIVCAAKDRETDQCVAIKKVTPMAKRTTDAKHTLREVLLLQHLGKHPNVRKYLVSVRIFDLTGSFVQVISIHSLSANVKDDELYIVMDLMDTDMHRVIQSSQPLSDAHAKYFLHQLLRGVKYLHDNGVLHRDLKPGNLLLSKTCQLKIADFGLARKIPRGFGNNTNTLERPRSAPAASSKTKAPDRPPMTEHVVTRWYRAPELMLQPDGLYDQSVDMWSVGCIFAEILGRKALFPGKNFLHQLTLIFDVIGAPSAEAVARIQSSQAQRFLNSLSKKSKVPFRTIFPNASDSAVDLLDRMLEFDPAKRISAQEALAHPYMQDIERKYRNRGGVDPPPCMRADFSFDLKNLTKVDLRALIVKEVDNHRKSTLPVSNSDPGIEAVDTANIVEKNRSGFTPSSIPSVKANGSGARISKVHANLRQAQEQSQQHERNVNIHQRPASAVTLGSNRQRIRTNSKPPVPKQQESSVWVSNQQEHVRVVAAQATLLSDSLTSRISPPPEEDTSTSQDSTSTTWKSKQHQDTKHSLSTSSSSSNSTPPKDRISDNNLCTAVSRSNRPGSAMLLTKSVKKCTGENVSATNVVGRPRRVSSAGTARSKPRVLPATGSYTARNSNTNTTYVGSINSLIHAQRSNNGQSLADSADNVLANMNQAKEQESNDSRIENAPSESQLHRQRSSSKLPGTDITGKRSKRLTVPKSPKFSVMSWQKKSDGKVRYTPSIFR